MEEMGLAQQPSCVLTLESCALDIGPKLEKSVSGILSVLLELVEISTEWKKNNFLPNVLDV